MAQQFVVTKAELEQLIASVELAKLRIAENSTSDKKSDIDAMHRSFHYQVVRWVQDVAGLKS